ncbi:hepatitis A virus cellular receptor 1 homolog [Suncus etruscus]|uniref:hepatitis A virus cellular receptor 1 homolog n=1 Tax=Suncus etruscus TaxID=109475 RepID=UPI00210FA0B7|nr:hepatitis A virus cellular receptor 1 homolog [Suncus etruscus]
MCPWVAIAGLLVFVTDAAAARDVSGVAGYPVTLPCTYSSASTSMCWGRGPCPNSQCSDVLIWTDGSKVTYQKAPRYELQGKITQGDVSLTIKEATLADSGVYCCRIEHPGWFNDQRLTFSLEIKPDVNDTAVTQTWDGAAHENQTLTSLAKNPWMTTSKGLGIGFSIVAVVLVTFLVIPVVLVTKKHLFPRKKQQQQQLSMMTLHGPNVTALQSAAAAQVRAEDNIYTVEDNPYVID